MYKHARLLARLLHCRKTGKEPGYKATRLHEEVLDACSPRKFFESVCSKIASEASLGQKEDHSSYMACGVLNPIFGLHLLSQLTSNFHKRRYIVGSTAGGVKDGETVSRPYVRRTSSCP